MAQIDQLFKIMVAQGASDLHLSSGAPPYLRLHGEMVKVEHPELNNEGVQTLVFEILNEKQRRLFIENWELDCSYAVTGLGRFRCNIFMQRRGMGAVFRVIPEVIKTVQELGLPEIISKLIETPRGLVLVTGPTGSGKSTTLAAMLHTINLTTRQHILTVEDPIEFVHENRTSLFNQREVNSHTKSFANALKAALREDPDTILVGELRDLETIALAITAAETGHLVFGTLHTNSAAKTVDRIIDAFPEGQQAQIRVMLSESLRGVVAQTLFPRADKPGRVAAIEVLINTFAVANLIREGKTFQIPSAMQTGTADGMMTFESHLKLLLSQGKVKKEDAENFLGRSIKSESTVTTANTSGGSKPGSSPRPATSTQGGNTGSASGIKILSTEDGPTNKKPQPQTTAPTPSTTANAIKGFVFGGGGKKTG